LQKLGDKKKDLASRYKEACDLYGKESEEALKLKEALDQCKSEYDETNNKIKSNNKAINSNTVEMAKSEAELVKLQGELKNTNQAIKENSSGFLQASKEFEKAGVKLQKLGGYISDAGGKLMKISAPMVAFSGYALKVTMDFEEGMAKVQAISGATAEDMVLLSDKAKEMGKNTKFSATESAEALSYMAMAGWKTQDMLNGLPGIMDLAAASGENLGLVSDIVTDAMTAFGMSTERSSEFADVLASASNNANTNVAMLGESFKYVAPLAGSLGYNVQDTSIALGLMANSGIKASQAGTSLKTALVNMAKPTDNMKAVMNKYGLSLQNTDGSMKSLREVINMLRENMKGLDEATLASASATLFGKESLAGMLAIINASESDYNKLTNAIDNSSGASKKMADIMNKTAKGQITLLKSNLESLGISIGEKLLPHVNSLIDKLNNLIDWFGNLDEETQQSILKFGLMTFATGGLLKAVGGLTTGIGGLSKGIGGVLGWLGKMSTTTVGVATATGELATATATATTGVSAFGGGLSVLSGIALPAIATIGALGLAFYGAHEWNGNNNG
jgi:TP901 family phage tail tape measure protein